MIHFFKKKQNKEAELDAVFAKVTEELRSIDDWDDPKKLEHYILDSCEQIIATTKEIEGEKKEYRRVTSYLNDVTRLEELPDQDKARLREVANNVVELSMAQRQYENAAPKISDSQYDLMEENADVLPETIERMMENERYQDTIKKNMRFLEGEKSRYEMDREDEMHTMKVMRLLSILLIISFASVLVLIFLLQYTLSTDISWYLLFTVLFTACLGVFIFLRFSQAKRDSKKSLRKLNQSISMLNSVRIRYVNITNAIEYVCDKYQVRSASELKYLWNQYLVVAKEREQYRNNNSDLEYFLMRYDRELQSLNLYDPVMWQNKARAIVDKNEMVEVKHELIQRRQGIRKRIQDNTVIVKSERDEIDKLMREHNYYVPEIMEIIQSVDKLCGLDQKSKRR